MMRSKNVFLTFKHKSLRVYTGTCLIINLTTKIEVYTTEWLNHFKKSDKYIPVDRYCKIKNDKARGPRATSLTSVL